MSRHDHRPACWANKRKDGSDDYEGNGKARPEVRSHTLGIFYRIVLPFFLLFGCHLVFSHMLWSGVNMNCDVSISPVCLLHWRGLKEVPSLDANTCCKCSAGQFVVSCIDIKSCYVSLTSVAYNVRIFTVFCMGFRSPELSGLCSVSSCFIIK